MIVPSAAEAREAKSPHHHAHAAGATAESASATPPDEESEHVVKDGETLGGIAARAKVPRILIAEANGLKRPYHVHAGQHLMLPRTRHHTVKPGETGFDLAIRFGVPYSAIAVANGLKPDAPLQVGQKLLIPTIISANVGPAHGEGTTPGTGSEATKAAEAASTDAASAEQPRDAADTATAPAFVWPLAGKVVRGFVARGEPDHHDGIDIAAAEGTAVRATADGKVIFAGEEPQSFGRLVVIDHQRGWQSAYGFLGKLTVAKGDTVRAHERIGLVGHTGKAPRDELHFEIRKADAPVDPRGELPVAPKSADPKPHRRARSPAT